MFKYTVATVNKIIDDMKRAGFILDILVNLLYIVYLIYAIAVGSGNPFVNATLCALTAAFFVSYVVTSLDERKKRARRIVKRTYNRIRIFLDCFSLAIAIYSVYIAAEHATVISILLTVGSIIGWIAKVTFAILTSFLEARARLFVSAFHLDLEPLYKIHNAYKLLIGDELSESVSPEMRRTLDDIQSEYAEEMKEKKVLLRERRRETRKARLSEWREARRARAEARREARKSKRSD